MHSPPSLCPLQAEPQYEHSTYLVLVPRWKCHLPIKETPRSTTEMPDAMTCPCASFSSRNRKRRRIPLLLEAALERDLCLCSFQKQCRHPPILRMRKKGPPQRLQRNPSEAQQQPWRLNKLLGGSG